MKKILLGMALGLLLYSGKGQTTNSIKVGYTLKLNLTRKSIADSLDGLTQIGYLMVAPGESFFFIDSKFQEFEKPSANPGLNNSVVIFDSMQKLYKNIKENDMICEEQGIGDKYWYRDSLHNQQWTLGSETKMIGSYECKKATCSYWGREYTAWFATEIPISNGPWKFGGLPGLILEVYDSERKIFYSLKSIQQPCVGKCTIGIETKKVISKQLFIAKFKQGIEKVNIYVQAQANQNAGTNKVKATMKFDTIEIY